MASKELFRAEKELATRLACGRTFDEQVASIEKFGNHGASSVLRNVVLAEHGIANPKANASCGIFFGCYIPFAAPHLLRDYLRLLDLLGVDYTWFDSEYCCGWPMLAEASGSVSEKARTSSEAFVQKNINLARGKKAETLAYCCNGCVYAAKHFANQSPEKQVYILDPICEAMEKRVNKMPPATVGYFEG